MYADNADSGNNEGLLINLSNPFFIAYEEEQERTQNPYQARFGFGFTLHLLY